MDVFNASLDSFQFAWCNHRRSPKHFSSHEHEGLQNLNSIPTAFAEAEDSINEGASTNTVVEVESIAEWLLEVPDDLDMYVAQRDFEEAVSLVERNRSFWENATPSIMNLHRDLK